MTVKNKETFFGLLLAAASALTAAAENYTIASGDVDDFTNKLEICNRARSGVITLEPGRYDVSKCSAVYWDTNGTEKRPDTHLAHDYITIRGATDNPRDVVVYGNGTKAIWYAYQGRIANLTVSNGYIKASSTCDGGAGITTYTQSAWVSNVVITCCASEKGGGATYLGSFQDCIIVSNRSVNSSGGASAGASSTSGRFYRCLVADNYSEKSGGAGNNCAYYDCILSNNTAVGSGGALYRGGNRFPRQTAELSNTVFVANRSLTGAGGALYDDSATICRKCDFIGNTATNGTGGAIYMSSTNLFFDCVISNNACKSNGGGAIGGGLYADCVIAFNRAGNEHSSGNLYGGGIQGAGSGYATRAVRCRIFGNACWYPKASASGNGGYSGGAGACELIDCLVYDNVAQSAGAATRDGYGSGTVFSNNVTLSSNPTVYLPKTAFSNCLFHGETIQPNGKSFISCRFAGHTQKKTLAEGANVVTNGTFASSSYLFQGAFAATNCLFSGNTISVLFRNNKATAPITLVNCTVTSNRINYVFDEFKMNNANYPVPAEVVNSIFVNNPSISGEACDLAFNGGSDRNVAFTNCLIGLIRNTQDPPLSEVNTVTNANPRFVMDGTSDQYALKHSSPARGKGLVQDWMTSVNDIRGEGFGRLRDEKGVGAWAVDIGCYQCWLDPVGSLLLFR